MERPGFSTFSQLNMNRSVFSHKKCSINSLPDELLGDILMESTGKDGCTPRRLAQVCRRWYQVAINTPRLWSDITVESFGKYGRPYVDRTFPPMETCTSPHELEQTLSRAKKSPLKILIACTHWSTGDYAVPARIELLRHLFSPEIAPQIIELHILINGFLIPEGHIDWSLCNFASLRKLTCCCIWPCANSFLKIIDKTALKLKDIDFTGSSPQIVLNEVWPRLKRLVYSGSTNIPVDSAIPHCQSLTYLACSNIDWPNIATPSTIFSEMDWMILKCSNVAYLANIQLPKLTTLVLHQRESAEDINDLTTIIPQVATIVLDLPELLSLSLTASAAWLATFRTPKLKSLTFTSRYWSPKWDDLCLMFVCTTIVSFASFGLAETLVLRTHASDGSIIETLLLMPNISSFRLTSQYTTPPKEFGQAIVQRMTSESNNEVLLPNLRNFEWGDSSSMLSLEEKEVAGAIQRLFISRREKGLPLEEVKTCIVSGPSQWSGEKYTYTRGSFLESGTV